MTIRYRSAAAAAVAAAALTLSACTDDSEPEAPDFTENTEGADSAETVTETVTEPADDTDDDSNAGDDSDSITVEASGSGPIAVTTDDAPDGESESIDGRLVTGQGSCFALVDTANQDGPPAPLILPSDAETVTQQGRPSVTLPGEDTVYVGDLMSVDAVSVQLSDLEGLPDQCAGGGSQTGLMVN